MNYLHIALPVTMIVDDGPLPALLTAATLMLYKVPFLKPENTAIVWLVTVVFLSLASAKLAAVM